MRTGVITQKIGMTRLFTDGGEEVRHLVVVEGA
jgi:hypothetical protein